MQTIKVQVNHNVVMNADADALVAMLVALFDADADYCAKVRKNKLSKLRALVGTRLANDKRYSAQYADGTLTYDAQVADADTGAQADASADAEADVKFAYEAEAEAEAEAQAQASAQASSKTKSAKAWLHELFSKRNADGTPARYTLADLCALTGKSEVNVRTMLSDLRSAKYAKPYAPLATVSTRSAGTTYYHLAR